VESGVSLFRGPFNSSCALLGEVCAGFRRRICHALKLIALGTGHGRRRANESADTETDRARRKGIFIVEILRTVSRRGDSILQMDGLITDESGRLADA
jgi:hypothetical protein